jgi:hypothetical protein
MAWPSTLTYAYLDAPTDDPSLARAELLAGIQAINSIIACRAATSGICDLDSSGKVPAARLSAANIVTALGGSITGALSVGGNVTVGDGSVATQVTINGATAATRYLRLQTGGTLRWTVGANTDAESGSNEGSNFQIRRYDDSATLLTSPFTIYRGTGRLSLGSGAADSGDQVNIQAGVTNVLGVRCAVSGAAATMRLEASRTSNGSDIGILRFDNREGGGAGVAAGTSWVAGYRDGVNGMGVKIATGVGTSPTARITVNAAGDVAILNNGSGSALTLTQTGTGHALLVEDASSPDSTPLCVTADGTVVKGATAAQVGYNSTGAIQVNGTASAMAYSTFTALHWDGSNTLSCPRVELGRSHGSAVGSYTAVVDGDHLGNVHFVGTDGTDFCLAAGIRAMVEGTPAAGKVPARLELRTCPTGGGATVRLACRAEGDVVVGLVALATTATAGFFWIPSCPGAPTGAPTAPYTNAAALVVDTTNNRLYCRVGSNWKYASLT